MWKAAEKACGGGVSRNPQCPRVHSRCPPSTQGSSPYLPWVSPAATSAGWHLLCPLPGILPLDFSVACSLYSDAHSRSLGLLSTSPGVVRHVRNECSRSVSGERVLSVYLLLISLCLGLASLTPPPSKCTPVMLAGIQALRLQKEEFPSS